MKNNIYPENYNTLLNVQDTQIAIKMIKDTFQRLLSEALGLARVSAPLFVEKGSGYNDELSGKETPISFEIDENKKTLEIVQSLAKWKRYALKKYQLNGLYTDMNAIRPHEDLDNMHSLYVDQWDWEKVITKNERNLSYLKRTVSTIYQVFLKTYSKIVSKFPSLNQDLPDEITFISTQELWEKYPNMSAKQRENAIAKEKKAVFLISIGSKLSNGEIHDTRASDYDDWDLNGDILLWYEPLQIAFELSSMGIRVDSSSLLKQVKIKNEEFKLQYDYHKAILNNDLPLTIGGGIGQSRLCMFLLKKAHVGEVQASYWDQKDIDEFKKHNIILL